MASLLDMLIARQGGPLGLLSQAPGGPQQSPGPPQPQLTQPTVQMPQMPTIRPEDLQPLAQAQPQPQPQQAAPAPQRSAEQGGVLGVIGQLFGGRSDPRLTPEQNNQARQQALLMAGLATLASDAPGVKSVAEGALVGQQVAAAARQQALATTTEEQRAKARQQILGGRNLSNPQELVGTVRDLLAAGLADEAGQLIDLRSSFEAPKLHEAGDKLLVFDPNDMTITESGVKLPKPPRDTSWQQVGDNLTLLDDQTGQPIASLSNPDRLSPAELRAISKDRFDRANALRDDLRSESADVVESVRMAQQALGAPVGAAGDQTLVVALNKLLDPTSVVREGEFDRVAQIGGFRAAAQRFANKIMSDGQLDAESRAQLRAEIDRVGRERSGEAQNSIQKFSTIAVQSDVNPEWVVGGLGVDEFKPQEREATPEEQEAQTQDQALQSLQQAVKALEQMGSGARTF